MFFLNTKKIRTSRLINNHQACFILISWLDAKRFTHTRVNENLLLKVSNSVWQRILLATTKIETLTSQRLNCGWAGDSLMTNTKHFEVNFVVSAKLVKSLEHFWPSATTQRIQYLIGIKKTRWRTSWLGFCALWPLEWSLWLEPTVSILFSIIYPNWTVFECECVIVCFVNHL